MLEILKAILFGVVEGITEWLPISSTGHLILLNRWVTLQISDAFYEMFEVVIQLGAILAVLVLFFGKLNPFRFHARAAGEPWGAWAKTTLAGRRETWRLWGMVVIAVIPSAVVGLLLDDWMDAHLYNYLVVALMLIVYGVAFIAVEKLSLGMRIKVRDVQDIDWRTALYMGFFQCLALVPGTSRSGATILGGILVGVARPAAADFSFFMAIPTMLGASALKLVKFALEGNSATGLELGVLAVGCVVSFIVSLAVIKGLMEYVRSHDFSVFGIYRIVLGVLVLLV